MTRRPKLSLEPDRQVRREPPTEFSQAPYPGTARPPTPGGRAPASPSTPSQRPRTASSAEGPGETTKAGGAQARPRPAPSAAAIDNPRATEPVSAPSGHGFDRATWIKVLVAAGVAAVTILLLKRRL